MYLVVLCFVILKLKPSISQFPNHMDLQKVGDTIFNNEIYNILKPTTHVVSDYFTDYLLRRENSKFPTKRLFIDDNGFRHYWSGFDKKTGSLRKTEILSDVVETDGKTAGKAENLTSTENKNSDNHNGAEKVMSAESKEKKNDKSVSVEKNDENKNSTDDASQGSEKPENSQYKTTTPVNVKKKSHKRKSRSKKTSNDGDVHLRGGETTKAPAKSKTNKKPPKEKTRNIVTTTFFCPFFGVITMSAFVD